MSHATKRATCRSNRTRDVGKVVDDEPTRGEVVDDELHEESRVCRGTRTHGIGEVVDDEPVRRAARRAEALGRSAEAK
jgi:hypothetical protein